MSRSQSVKRGVAVVSSGALVVGAGAAVGVIAADMSGQWSDEAAVKAASQVVADPGNDDPIPRAVVVTRIKERHVTPDPVEVHRKVYVRAPSGSAPRAQTARASTPQRKSVRSAPAPRPSRKAVAPAPAAPKASSGGSKAKSKTS